jgi:hypothetical protein
MSGGPLIDLWRNRRASHLAMVAAGYVMKRAGGGDLGGIFGGQPAADASVGSPQAQPSGSSDILGDLIGSAGKFLGR